MKIAAATAPRFVHAAAPLCAVDQGPLSGLRHRTVIDAAGGAAGLALWQEEHLPGFSVPPHRHDCEEIISVLAGRIEGTVEAKDEVEKLVQNKEVDEVDDMGRVDAGGRSSGADVATARWRGEVGPGESFLIPTGRSHGFRVLGDEPVRLLALFASARPRIFRADGTPSPPPWEGGASEHLEQQE